ncbi:hypothetical protein ACLI4R_03750 [Natrialbaceae archaeon A-chndr2]
MTNPVFVTDETLARTFDGGAYPDAWEAVQQYREATQYASKHGVKSGATASALELPRSRLRTWIDDGGKPDAVRCLETAREKGWLNVTYDDSQFAALNALVANVFSGGSIAESNYGVSFSLNHRAEESHVIDALELANVDYSIIRAEEQGRATEARPSAHGTVLGRVLTTLGAPLGPKASQRLEVPAYLEGAPDDVKRLFVVCYLENRASEFEGKSTLQVHEDRNQSYLEDMASLIEAVAGETVTVEERGFTITAAAARALGQVR